MSNFDISQIEKIIKYKFTNKTLLQTAFTHPSLANDEGIESNQRLEFLGDSILGFVIAEKIYKNYDEADEGKMSKWKSKIVNTDALSMAIKNLQLEQFIMLGNSFNQTKVIAKSILEDLFESIVGAIYLDGGLDKASKFIFNNLHIDNIIKNQDTNYKSELQEIVQKVKGSNIVYFTYELPRQEGYFCSEVYINDVFIAKAISTSKKESQIECACLALKDKTKIHSALKK